MSLLYDFIHRGSGNVLVSVEADDEADACHQFASWLGMPDYSTALATWGTPGLRVTAERFYDAQLVHVDMDAKRTSVALPDGQIREFHSAQSFHKPGAFGVLTISGGGSSFAFSEYVEQRLRRHGRSSAYAGYPLWDWLLDGVEPGEPGSAVRPIVTKRFFVPGMDGGYIENESEKVTVDVPLEFLDLCEARGLTPEQALRGFIADVCGLVNDITRPREDGYSSNGSDERYMAGEYFERAYPAPDR